MKLKIQSQMSTGNVEDEAGTGGRNLGIVPREHGHASASGKRTG